MSDTRLQRQKSIAEEEVKVWSHGRSERHFIAGRERSIVSVQDSQATHAGPSNKSRVEMKTLEWLETVACDRARIILIFWIIVELYNFVK